MAIAKKNIEPKEQNKAALKFRRDKDRQMVRGVFRFYEAPGASLKFNYRAYKEDPVETFTLVDGKVYTLPLGVAKHLNSGGYPEYEYIKGESTAQGADESNPMRIKRSIKRYGFQSLEFISPDEIGDPEQNKVLLVEEELKPIAI